MSVGGSTATAKKKIHNVFPFLKKSSYFPDHVLPSELAHSERDQELLVWADS